MPNHGRTSAQASALAGGAAPKSVRDVLAKAIESAKREARANELTDEDVDSELEAWRDSRRA